MKLLRVDENSVVRRIDEACGTAAPVLTGGTVEAGSEEGGLGRSSILYCPPTPPQEAATVTAAEHDVALVQAVRAGGRVACTALFNRYAAHVRNVLLRMRNAKSDLPDLLHDVFVVAIEKMDRLHKPTSLKDWLTGITVYQARALMRRRSLVAKISLEGAPRLVVPPGPATPEMAVALQRACEVLRQLPAKDRAAFLLRVLDRMTVKEVAASCGVSAATARRRVARAARLFRKLAKRHTSLHEWLERRGDVGSSRSRVG